MSTTAPNVANEASAPADDAATPAKRICVECGAKFDPPAKGPGQHKKFCETACRTTFANREKAQGAVLITLAKVHALTRHARDPEARYICRDVRAEIMRVLSVFLDEDKAAGRAERLPAYARTLVNIDNSYRERRRR